MRFPSASFLFLPAAFALGGCDAILGLGDYKESAATGSGGNGGGSSSSTSSSTSTSTTSSTSTGMTTSSGTGGSGGAMSCTPNEIVACPYLGTPGTEGHGLCTAGSMRCNIDGTGFEPCIGQVIDRPEDCMNGDDDDCDDVINDGCTCTPNQSVSCYSGPGGTDLTGTCHRGMATCNAQGTMLGPCVGEQTPLPEDCATSADENCNGAEAGGGPDTVAGCECVGTTTMSCYSGPPLTSGVGKCAPGTKTCSMGHYPSNCPGEVVPTAEVCATGSGDEDCNGLSCSEVTGSIFAGDPTFQDSVRVATDSTGNVYWIGSFQGSITIGGNILISAGNADIFVAKLTPAGVVSWAKRFGSSAVDTPIGIASDGVSVAVISATGTDWGGGAKTGATFAKLSATTGAFVWQHACTGPSAAGANGGIAFDNAKNIVVSMNTNVQMTCEGGTALPHGATDLVVAKYSNAGTHLWSRGIAGTVAALSMESAGIATDANGSLWVAGIASGAFNFGCVGGPLGTQGEDVFLAKLNSDGTCAQQYRFGGSSNDGAFAIAVDSLGGPVVSGYFTTGINFGTGLITPLTGTTDEFVVKLGSAGNVVWSKTVGVQSATTLNTMGLAADSTGDIVATGFFFNTANFGGGAVMAPNGAAFVVKYGGSSGVFKWADAFTVAKGRGVAVGASNRIHATGTFTGTPSNFGSMTMSSAGNSDVYLVQIDP